MGSETNVVFESGDGWPGTALVGGIRVSDERGEDPFTDNSILVHGMRTVHTLV